MRYHYTNVTLYHHPSLMDPPLDLGLFRSPTDLRVTGRGVSLSLPRGRRVQSRSSHTTTVVMDEAPNHRGGVTAEVAVYESIPSAELIRMAGIVPAACVLYANTQTQETPELQWQIASYADVELLMGEAPTLIGCVHQDPWLSAIRTLGPTDVQIG